MCDIIQMKGTFTYYNGFISHTVNFYFIDDDGGITKNSIKIKKINKLKKKTLIGMMLIHFAPMHSATKPDMVNHMHLCTYIYLYITLYCSQNICIKILIFNEHHNKQNNNKTNSCMLINL